MIHTAGRYSPLMFLLGDVFVGMWPPRYRIRPLGQTFFSFICCRLCLPLPHDATIEV